jgi:hypothetical protein
MLPLFRWHLIQLPQSIGRILLLLWRQPVKPLLVLKLFDLLVGSQTMVLLEPFTQVLLA